ncbi:MAG TPA: hypothetical protein VLA56_17540 [Pseudomonadales bacterium]|nr:hypothetical protein [Pseudomonadales bacterium]
MAAAGMREGGKRPEPGADAAYLRLVRSEDPADRGRALAAIRLRAEAGDPRAQHLVGAHLAVDGEPVEAARCFERAARAGLGVSAYRLYKLLRQREVRDALETTPREALVLGADAGNLFCAFALELHGARTAGSVAGALRLVWALRLLLVLPVMILLRSDDPRYMQ